jgi:hypothetical protein
MSMSGDNMAHKNVRIDNGQWAAAQERAALDGTTISSLIRQWVADYVAGEMPSTRLTPTELDRICAEVVTRLDVPAAVRAVVGG